jgi:DNA polymerase-3 subunit epsilon
LRELCGLALSVALDIAFLNAELKRAAKPPIATERVIDTLVLARRKHAGGHNTLDDLCSRYGVNSLRSKHSALLDAEVLAAVYVSLVCEWRRCCNSRRSRSRGSCRQSAR